jgi:hypothetical protein
MGNSHNTGLPCLPECSFCAPSKGPAEGGGTKMAGNTVVYSDREYDPSPRSSAGVGSKAYQVALQEYKRKVTVSRGADAKERRTNRVEHYHDFEYTRSTDESMELDLSRQSTAKHKLGASAAFDVEGNSRFLKSSESSQQSALQDSAIFSSPPAANTSQSGSESHRKNLALVSLFAVLAHPPCRARPPFVPEPAQA